jgi:FecR protein
MKFKLIAAILGIAMAIPGVVIAQAQDDQAPDQDAKPSPNVQMQGPNDQSSPDQGPMDSDQGGVNQPPANQAPNPTLVNPGGPMQPGPNAGPNAPTYNTPAPEEKNGVARISLIHGDVSTQRGDSKDWSAAALNAPVVAGDRVSTGDKARTEVELDYANTLRLAEHTQANIVQLTRSNIQIQLGHGMANYTVYGRSDVDAEIDTPNVAIKTERRDSSFRILVTADDHTEVLVRKGEVEITTPQGGTRVGQGQFITVQGTGADEQYKIGEAPARDDWDQWNTDRDNMIRNSEARRHTNDYYVGTENLDGNGTWSEVPDYGPVWRPNEPAGWAPYRDGRWVYEPYWGWTWVSYDSWGWAPYHYGRWMYVDGGWGWWPGPAYGYPFYRPIWAPAYVSFFGFGPGFGIGFGFGFGFGSIGWLPLGPGDFFHPWWGRWGGGYGFAGFGGLNRGGFAPLRAGSRFSNVNLAMHDANFRGATSVSGREFGSGHTSAQAVGHAQMQNARFSTGRLGVSPGRESFSASGRAAAASTTRNASENQHFFSTHGTTAAAGSRSAETGREGTGARSGDFGSRGGSNVASSERYSQGAERSAERSASAGGREGGSSGGWQKFSPMSSRSSAETTRSDSSRSESARSGESAGRSSYGSSSYGSSRGSASESRGYGSGSYGSASRGYGGSSRPPLNMRQPIVTQRSYGGGAYGGGRSAPSYGGGRSAPSFGGSRSAPSGRGSGSPHSGGASHGGGSHGGGHGR